jgi:hypothetical protein
MTFIEEEIFHDKGRNMIVYQKVVSILLVGSPD